MATFAVAEFTDKMVESAIRRTIKTSDHRQAFEVRKVEHDMKNFTIEFAGGGNCRFTVTVPYGLQNYKDLTDLVCTVGERVQDRFTTMRDMDVLSQILLG